MLRGVRRWEYANETSDLATGADLAECRIESKMNMTIVWWVVGLAIPLAVGTAVVPLFLKWLRKRVKLSIIPTELVPGWLTGLLERAFFTVLVAFNVSGTGVAMIGWITVKMASGWNSGARSDPGVLFPKLRATIE